MRSWRKANTLLLASFLFASILARAQSGPPVPNALAVPSGNTFRFSAEAPQGLDSSSSLALQPEGRDYSFAADPGSFMSAQMPPIPNTGLEYASQGIHLDLSRFLVAMNRPTALPRSHPEEEPTGPYSWRGLLWQSLALISLENAQRLATDHYLRHLIAGGPYWRNYMISMQHWDMNRWSDGDSFLVDDIGHPMQGAVSGFIEIQNSPRQRVLRISRTREYWRSRFLAMMWATIYSTQQKIGPLGEAAVGNDGGFTYTPGCEFNCPPEKLVKYTNNTGWTDFIMTPAGGTVWMIFEDFLDRAVSDRVEDAHPDSIFPKILRGAINPTRSVANFLRWRTPWYRDFRHYDADRHITPGIHFIPDDEYAASRAPRFELFPHYDAISLLVNTASCTWCRQMLPGYGVGFAARLTRRIDFDSDVDYHSNASPVSSYRAGGSAIMGTFGVRSGLQFRHYALKVALRPGFLSYSQAYQIDNTTGLASTNIGRITHFVTALDINGDYDLSRHFAVRAAFGNTPVRYRVPAKITPGPGKPPYLNWLAKEVFATDENWTYKSGVVLRF